MHDALGDKDSTRFWRSWNAKFGHKSHSEVISGHSDHQSIADTFSDLYAKQSLPNNSNTHNKLIQEFHSMYCTYTGSPFDAESAIHVHVELVDSVIRGLKRGRAAGLDGVSAEHMHFSHPIICVLLSILVKLILKYSYVPDAFGVGMIIPLLKGDDNL